MAISASVFLAAMAASEASAQAPRGVSATRHESAGISRPKAIDDVKVCHKDHAGLSLASAEPLAGASERLSAIVDAGGALLAAEVADLDCPYCVAAIEDALTARTEIAATYYDQDRSRLLIALEPGAAIENATIRKIIERRGYDVVTIDKGALPLTTGGHVDAALDNGLGD